MDYTDSINILEAMRQKPNVLRPKTLQHRAKKVLHQAECAKHFVRVFDTTTADGIFDIIVSNFLE